MDDLTLLLEQPLAGRAEREIARDIDLLGAENSVIAAEIPIDDLHRGRIDAVHLGEGRPQQVRERARDHAELAALQIFGRLDARGFEIGHGQAVLLAKERDHAQRHVALARRQGERRGGDITEFSLPAGDELHRLGRAGAALDRDVEAFGGIPAALLRDPEAEMLRLETGPFEHQRHRLQRRALGARSARERKPNQPSTQCEPRENARPVHRATPSRRRMRPLVSNSNVAGAVLRVPKVCSMPYGMQ